MDFSEYIDAELYAIIPLLYALGILLKKSSINDKWIPLVLGAAGIFFALAYKLAAHLPNNASEAIMLGATAVSQGVLCASASVYADNILKQLKTDGKSKASQKESESGENGNFGG